MKISVVLPVYNLEKYLSRCVESILGQSFSDFELIIVDDGSNDSTGEMCDKYALLDSRIVVIHQTNCGVSVARNVGIDRAVGDYVFFIDGDDWIEKDAFRRLYSETNDDMVDVVICNNYVVSGYAKKVNNIIDDSTAYSFFEFISYNVLWSPWAKLIKKDVIKNMFDPGIYIGEDLLFWYDNSRETIRYKFINSPLYNYSNNPDSALHRNAVDKKDISYLDVLIKLIALLDNKRLIDFYKLHYVGVYYFYLSRLSIGAGFPNQHYYAEIAKRYYKDARAAVGILSKKGMKLFLQVHFTGFYIIMKRMSKRKRWTKCV